MRDNGNYNAFRNRPHSRLRSVFTLHVYAALTAGNADVYAPRNAVVRRELRRLGLPSKERAECGYAGERSAQHWRLRSDGEYLRSVFALQFA